MRAFTVLITILVAAVITGCGGGGGGGSAPPPPVVQPEPEPEPTGLWVSGGEGETLTRFRASFDSNTLTGGDLAEEAPAFAPGADDGQGGASGTYTLEASIDEHDILKYDNRLLVVAAGGSSCCFFIDEPLFVEDTPAADLAGPLLPPERGMIRLYRTDPAAGSATAAGAIELESNLTIEGLYLADDAMQVLASSAYYGTWGDALAVPEYWSAQQFRLSHYDLADPENPVETSVMDIEGALLLSRRVGDVIHVVTRHTPVVEGLVYYPVTAEQEAENTQVLEALDEQALLPAVTRNGEPVVLPDPDTCYRTDLEHPLAIEAPAELSMTTLLSLSASTGEIVQTACTLDPVSGVAITGDSAIFTWVEYAADGPSTVVHLLALEEWKYQGSARIPGYLYTGGNSDFRINQYEGVLRIVTSAWQDDEDDRFDHYLYTLAPAEDRPELDILGQLPEVGGEELGKPNEDLYGVRFLGPRAYLVTFERIDPLYVLDLADPSAPRIAGVLEVPGFSDLLHPVNEALLMGVGSDAEGRAKVELFDISDTSNPRSVMAIDLLPEFDWSYSPAQYNRYAFTYLPGDDDDRYAIPVSGWRSDPALVPTGERVVLLELKGKNNPESAQLGVAGEVVLSPDAYVSDRTRTVLDGDAIYIASEAAVFSGFWTNPEAVSPVAIPAKD